MKIRTSLKAIMVLAGILFLLVWPISSKADIVTYQLTLFDINGYTGSYADVVVSLDSTGKIATITFTSNVVGGNAYLMGGEGAADVNVNATSFTVATPNEANSYNPSGGFTPSLLHHPLSNSWLGSGTVDGWGVFNLTIKNSDGFGDSATSISFSLTNTSGTWSSASNVLIPNADGHLAASHIFVTSSPANKSNGAISTGYATDGVSVPEPGILILLGLGMMAVGVASRYIRKI